ncbi:MAG: hypothetical protein ACI85O_002907 [Saprospiraceae bacterium]|jgi:hypothetical protein
MKKHITLSLLLMLLLAFSVNAQTVKVNADGDKIVEYSDGTWRYLEPGEEIPTILPTPSIEEEEIPVKLNPIEQDAEFQSRIQAIRDAEKKQRNVDKLQVKIRDFAQERLKLETELAILRGSEVPDPTQEELLGRRILKARETEKKTRKEIVMAKAEAEFYSELVDMSQKKREKALLKYEAERIAYEQKLQQIKAEKTATNTKNNSTNSSRPKTSYAIYTPSKDVILNPPKYACNIKIDEVDEFTGKRRKTTESELLFTYTRDEIRPYYKDREHTICNANVTAMGGGIYVFSLEIAIASRTAQQEYGGILSNATLMVILLDGSTVSMVNNRTNRGKYDAVRDVHTFQGNYQIPPKQIKGLLEGEIDKIRVVWEEGYDTYDVYEMDFLRNHLKCLMD